MHLDRSVNSMDIYLAVIIPLIVLLPLQTIARVSSKTCQEVFLVTLLQPVRRHPCPLIGSCLYLPEYLLIGRLHANRQRFRGNTLMSFQLTAIFPKGPNHKLQTYLVLESVSFEAATSDLQFVACVTQRVTVISRGQCWNAKGRLGKSLPRSKLGSIRIDLGGCLQKQTDCFKH